MKTILYHNQSCSKSNAVFSKLQELSEDLEVINYLENTPTKEALTEIIRLLGIPAHELIRKNEVVFQERYLGAELSENEWIAVMIKHPILIERPIVIHDGKAAIGRPLEQVLNLFK